MSPDVAVIEVREAHRFDEAALHRFLAEKLPEYRGPLKVWQFQGGQSNPTFLLEAGGRRYVLRKKPPGKLLPSAHAVDREYRIISALQNTDVPVATARVLCEDDSVIGTPFYVMDYIDGRVISDPKLGTVEPAQRRRMYEVMAETLAKLHRVDWKAVGLEGYGRPENYVARQVSRWTKQYEASKTEDSPAMDRLIEWLPVNMPPDETTIAHGDYRMGNLMWHPTEPVVLAVLDWELSTIGHPLADLGYNCLAYRQPAQHELLRGLVGEDLNALNIPPEPEYLEHYCRAVGREQVPNWEFFLAFSLFRSAAIVEGVYARALQGNAADARAQRYKGLANEIAEIGWRIAEQS